MSTLLAASNTAAICLLMVMASRILLDRMGRLSQLIALQCVLLGIYLSLGLVDYQSIHPALSFVVARLSSLFPAAIWLLAFFLFRQRGSVPWYMWMLFGVYAGTRALGVGLLNLGIVENSTFYYLTFIVGPQLVMLGLSVHAIYMALSGYDADLVETRRQSRVIFVVSVALFTVLTRIKTWIVYNGVVQGVHHSTITTPVLDELISLYGLVFAVAFFLASFRSNQTLTGLLPPAVDSHAAAELRMRRTADADRRVVRQIRQAMERNLFAEQGLTVGGCAAELGIQPRLLRRLISEHFRFDNFNQFLNHYRLQEAARQLRTTKLSISRIAYDVGFSTISTFNTAFKAQYEQTPTAYRNAAPELDASASEEEENRRIASA